MILRALLVLLLAGGLAAFTYLRLERIGRRGWVPLVCRAVAWAALGLLLLNLSCPVSRPPGRPLVLLDASLSMAAAGGHWAEARDSAARWGDVRRFGDEQGPADTLPSRGRSLLAPALTAASASDRRVVVVTDGEIEDAADLPPDLLPRATVRIFPRTPRPDLALVNLSGPARVTSGDSIPLELEVEAVGGATADTVTVEATLGGKRLAARRLRLTGGSARGRLVLSSSAVGPGEHVLHVTLATPTTRSRAPTPACISSRWRRPPASYCSRRRLTGTADSSTARSGRSRSCRSGASCGSIPTAGDRWPTFRWCPTRQCARQPVGPIS